MSFRPTVIGFATVLSLCALAGSAFAEDRIPYCHGYADTAICQAHAVRAVSSCYDLVAENPYRWQLSWEGHYRYCLAVFASGRKASENQARAAELDACVNHR